LVKIDFIKELPEIEDDKLISNIYKILKCIKMPNTNENFEYFIPIIIPKEISEETEPKNTKKRKLNEDLERAITKQNLLISSLKPYQKLFQKIWLSFLSLKLPGDIYQSILENLHESVMPSITNPSLLLDFLTESYNMGGETSILALQGLFILMTTHHLDYPDFFPKLYTLFDIDVCYSKYRHDFFNLSYRFLCSPMIPQYMVNAFIKKMARLCLLTSPDVSTILLPLIYNIMVNHPTSQILIHRDPTKDNILLLDEVIKSDEFNFETKDISEANALKSSLWEFNVLNNHYISKISSLINMFKHHMKTELDLSQFLDKTIEGVFEDEIKRKAKLGTPLEYNEPKTLINPSEYPLWQL